jgi:serine phosphatase RsbU (regulator of sigma subunit)/CheY-like chemotaxis protein
VVTQNGEQALDWLSKHKPSLVITDIVMPEMNGFELCEKIKSDERAENIPVILLTSLSDPSEIIEGLSCGADGFISKPYNKAYLLSNIEKLLAEKATPESKKDTLGIDIDYGGKRRILQIGKHKVVELLLNIYQGSIYQNNELIQNRNEMRLLNERLEKLIIERTKDMKIIEFKNQLINKSIRYAHTIQTAVLDASENGSDFFSEQFCLIIPRDIVSGDFYWFQKIDNKLLVCVFDCTGHGVPGAFMSMLGVTLLNETVIREGICEPHLILNRLRKKIIGALGQKGTISEVRDGMEGSIISYDPARKKLVYSGAYNSIYLIRDNEIIEFKGDRMPLSYHDKMTDFTFREIDTLPDDRVYLFTDGFVDQFGGKGGKKFRSDQLKEVLLKVHKNPFEVQKQLLTDAFNNWRGMEEQVDDITVVGLKL